MADDVPRPGTSIYRSSVASAVLVIAVQLLDVGAVATAAALVPAVVGLAVAAHRSGVRVDVDVDGVGVDALDEDHARRAD